MKKQTKEKTLDKSKVLEDTVSELKQRFGDG